MVPDIMLLVEQREHILPPVKLHNYLDFVIVISFTSLENLIPSSLVEKEAHGLVSDQKAVDLPKP